MNKLVDTNNSSVITRGKGWVGEGKGGINGDRRRLDGGVNTQYSAQTTCYRIAHLKPLQFY